MTPRSQTKLPGINFISEYMNLGVDKGFCCLEEVVIVYPAVVYDELTALDGLSGQLLTADAV